jgi:dimethylargininase
VVALTREVSPALAACQLTHLPRVPIDLDRARAEHAAYEGALGDAGYRVERLSSGPGMPDCVFVEDNGVVLEEMAIVTRPGAESRRGEVEGVAAALSKYRALQRVEAPGTMDGGDVLVAGRRVFVGVSSRTNRHAAAQVRLWLEPRGYFVSEIDVARCLHLKSAVTLIDEDMLLVNADWIDTTRFSGFELIAVDPREPGAANALGLRDRVIFPSAFPRTAERLDARGLRVVPVDVSELAKAEGAVTCCSLLVAPLDGRA